MRLDDFLEAEKQNILNKYKADPNAVLQTLNEEILKVPSFLQIVKDSTDMKSILKRKEYKLFSKKVKKEIYYSLRQYHLSGKEHISTKEREPHLEEFLSSLLQNYSNVETILDIGGGMFPATFPFERFPKLKYYIWIDKDKKAYEELVKLNNPKLILHNDPIGEHSWEYYLPDGVNQFDLALMVKLISVVWRQEKNLIPLLVSIPARTLLVTVPKESMTKRASVEHRERATLQHFVDLTGRNVTDTLDIENELGYFLE